MSCNRPMSQKELEERGILARLFHENTVDVPCDFDVVHREDGSWIRESYGIWSDGAYRRGSEILPVAVFSSPAGRSVRGRVDCAATELRSLIIKKCRNCGDIDEDYSQLPLSARL